MLNSSRRQGIGDPPDRFAERIAEIRAFLRSIVGAGFFVPSAERLAIRVHLPGLDRQAIEFAPGRFRQLTNPEGGDQSNVGGKYERSPELWRWLKLSVLVESCGLCAHPKN
jgi:hypothetical protein